MEKKKVFRFFIKIDGEGLDVDSALVNAFEKVGISNVKGLSGDIDWKEMKDDTNKNKIYVVPDVGEA
jgi:hypothetical protein|tara:strand:- start:15853 stop:16053 length:201 start_codon:yes stop_codon:yes gene_type:complete